MSEITVNNKKTMTHELKDFKDPFKHKVKFNQTYAFSIISTLVASILFGFGLELAQMTNPQKVIGFLDIFGNWDPSLAFVMVGAISVNALLYRFIIKRKKPLLGPRFFIPTRCDLDKNLILGSALFGLGWGIGGFCPGPALAGLFRGQNEIFVVAMSILAGMFAYNNLFMKKKTTWKEFLVF